MRQLVLAAFLLGSLAMTSAQVDEDFCATDHPDHPCDANADCTDNLHPTPGATCACKAGYMGDGRLDGVGCLAFKRGQTEGCLVPIKILGDGAAMTARDDGGGNGAGDESLEVFSTVKGTGQDVYDAWAAGPGAEIRHNKCPVLDLWDTLPIKLCLKNSPTVELCSLDIVSEPSKKLFHLYSCGNHVDECTPEVKLVLDTPDGDKEFLFNGENADKFNWFSKSRMLSSPYNDISTQPQNYFSAPGETNVNRRFYLSRNHNGCEGDLGWMMVAEGGYTVGFCWWERTSTANLPLIKYSKNSGYARWASSDVGVANRMIISLAIATDGAQCSCPAGHIFNNDGSCSDVDECANSNGGCAQTCTNNVGSFSCSCTAGYVLNADGFACDDVDECASANGGCAQTCTNNVGSFSCSCPAGYVLNADGFACDDVDECASGNGGCAQTCTNNVGSFGCSCTAGYVLNADGFTCDDVDECASGNGGCAQTCTNNVGSFSCSCTAGYVLNADGFACDDVDECASANGGCAQTCTNNVGSFSCSCPAGYVLNADGFACDDVDECANSNGGCAQTCTNNVGSFSCSCTAGYVLNADGFTCDDCATAYSGLRPASNFGFHQGQCFWSSSRKQRLTYAAALQACQSNGGTLIMIKDSATHTFIMDHLKKKSVKGGKERRFWMGLDDLNDENVFLWNDGTPLGAFNRFKSSPHKIRDCVTLWKKSSRAPRWYIKPCTNSYPYICQMAVLWYVLYGPVRDMAWFVNKAWQWLTGNNDDGDEHTRHHEYRESFHYAEPERYTDEGQLWRDHRKKVTLDSEETKHAKELVRVFIIAIVDTVKEQIDAGRPQGASRCRIEYTGSMYEGTKFGRPDEFDIMIVIDGSRDIESEEITPGYARLRAGRPRVTRHRFAKCLDPYQNISPRRMIDWFTGLVQKGVNQVSMEDCGPVSLKVFRHGPAVMVNIRAEDDVSIDVDLVLCVQLSYQTYFVAKPYKPYADEPPDRLACHPGMLWRRSFSVIETRTIS
ncbi:hypothetical protein Bbelb_308660, partial [Branchiostoma belcheri]